MDYDIPVVPVYLTNDETSTVKLSIQGNISGRCLREKLASVIPQSRLRVAILNSDHTDLERIVYDEQNIASAELPNVCILQCINPRQLKINICVRWPAKIAGDIEMETIPLVLNHDDKLSDIATAVMQQTTLRRNVHICDQIFCYNGWKIRDKDQSKSLVFHNIVPNSTIEMIVISADSEPSPPKSCRSWLALLSIIKLSLMYIIMWLYHNIIITCTCIIYTV